MSPAGMQGRQPKQQHQLNSACIYCLSAVAGFGTPRDLADVAIDAVLSMDGQHKVLQQSAVLAGIASVRQVHDQQVSTFAATEQRNLMQRSTTRDACQYDQLCVSMASATPAG